MQISANMWTEIHSHKLIKLNRLCALSGHIRIRQYNRWGASPTCILDKFTCTIHTEMSGTIENKSNIEVNIFNSVEFAHF